MKRWHIGAGLMVLLVGVVLGVWWHGKSEGAAPVDALSPLAVSGPAAPTPDIPALPPEPVDYYRDVKPILDSRCVVCHGCYDAPCQLKLDSPEGVRRGASKQLVYDGTRLSEAQPTRLLVDARTTAEWREKGFFPVLNEGENNEQANLEGSVFWHMLDLKQRHALPAGDLPESIDVRPERRAFCPSADTMAQYGRERPLEGMPFALAPIPADKVEVLRRWLAAGAPVAEPPPLPEPLQRAAADWEKFLNADALKTQLMSRYLYEHLFLADLYFEQLDQRQFFKLVRSRTPPGQPIDVIATRRPYEDPGVARVYYRLQPVRSTILAKTHMPYPLGDKRMQRYREWFLSPDYAVTALPSYAPEVAGNPFVAFAGLPVRSRYRFLLEDAEFTLMNFVKGPVCRGQVALNVIDDRFWVLFANPNIDGMVDSDFLARESANLRLPAQAGNGPLAVVQWRRYAELQADYLAAKKKYLHEKFGRRDAVTLNLLWNGDGENSNAALTIFRHYDSASVVKGFVGDTPKTAWVVDYPMLERIHYLLAAGFDVYGDAGHQLLTRLYMDFLRMEGEYNFLAFLPRAQRETIRNGWYRGVGAKMRDSVYRKTPEYLSESGIAYHTDDPRKEFFDRARHYLGPVLYHGWELKDIPVAEPALEALQKLATLRGRSVSVLPEVVLLRVIRKNAPDEVFTLIHNDDYSNVAVLLFDRQRRRPQFDTLTVVPGFIGAYPNAFWRVAEENVPQLVQAVTALDGPESYRAFHKRFGVQRNGDTFWRQSDWMHSTWREREPVAWGMLDYSRYER